MQKLLIGMVLVIAVSFTLPVGQMSTEAQLQPPSDPVGCQKCGQVVLILSDGTVIVFDPACVEVPFGSGGAIFCTVTPSGCDLQSLCRVA